MEGHSVPDGSFEVSVIKGAGEVPEFSDCALWRSGSVLLRRPERTNPLTDFQRTFKVKGLRLDVVPEMLSKVLLFFVRVQLTCHKVSRSTRAGTFVLLYFVSHTVS